MGAALAYYAIFSVGPLVLITTALAGLAFGEEAVRGEVSSQIRGLLGDTGASAVEVMLAGASKPHQGAFASIAGIVLLVFTGLAVVAQLKAALNTIWEVEETTGIGIWSFVRSYLISLAAVLALGFLLLVSLLFTTALALLGKTVAPSSSEVSLQFLGSMTSFAFITVLFAMMFKWLPDTHVAWRDVWLGAAVTAALFEAGKFLIGFYLGRQALESTYGASASFLILLIWVYYSSQIVLWGAEFTHVCAKRSGRLGAEIKTMSVGR
jgi:membrane protein